MVKEQVALFYLSGETLQKHNKVFELQNVSWVWLNHATKAA